MSFDDCEFPKISFEEALSLSKFYDKHGLGYNNKCLMFKGVCISKNTCPCLLNPRGGYFGWGECVHNKEESE